MRRSGAGAADGTKRMVPSLPHAPPYPFGAFSDLDEAVRGATVRVREHPFLPHRDRVRGFVYEVETGHLREVIAWPT